MLTHDASLSEQEKRGLVASISESVSEIMDTADGAFQSNSFTDDVKKKIDSSMRSMIDDYANDGLIHFLNDHGYDGDAFLDYYKNACSRQLDAWFPDSFPVPHDLGLVTSIWISSQEDAMRSRAVSDTFMFNFIRNVLRYSPLSETAMRESAISLGKIHADNESIYCRGRYMWASMRVLSGYTVDENLFIVNNEIKKMNSNYDLNIPLREMTEASEIRHIGVLHDKFITPEVLKEWNEKVGAMIDAALKDKTSYSSCLPIKNVLASCEDVDKNRKTGLIFLDYLS